AAWGRILRALLGSRLFLLGRPGASRDRVIANLSNRGIDPARVDFIGYQSMSDYLRTYQRMDIALDPFPYNGGTTTCDALAMGVPVVTLAGNTATARAWGGILSKGNLAELIG